MTNTAPFYRRKAFWLFAAAMSLVVAVYAWPAGWAAALAVGAAGGTFAAFVLWILAAEAKRLGRAAGLW